MGRRYLLPWVIVLAGVGVPEAAGAAVFWNADRGAPPAAIEDDLYVAGEQVAVSQSVRDDVVAAGQRVAVTGEVGGDILAAGQEIVVNGSAGGDVRAAGGTVSVTGAARDDVLAAGNEVRFSGSADGDLLVAGGSIAVGGEIGRDIQAAGGQIVLTGKVHGTVRAAGGHVEVADGAIIEGDLLTWGEREPVLAPGARIGGRREHRAMPNFWQESPQQALGAWVRSVLGWFILTVVFLYLLPQLTGHTVAAALERSGLALGLGAVGLLVGMPLVVLLSAVVVGWPAAVLVLAGTAAAMVVAASFSMLAVGVYVARRLRDRQGWRWHHALVGVVAVRLLLLVPVAGPLLVFVIMLLAFGALLLTLWRMFGRRSAVS